MPALHTFGHSTRSLADTLSLLKEHGIQHVFDVRRFPVSRRHPHFNGPALAATLRDQGIDYTHEEDLGGRRVPVPDSVNAVWRDPGFRGYADYMSTAAFRVALQRLLAQAATQRTAIMCAEAVPWRCHRNLIADAAVAAGTEVVHILGPGAPSKHVLNPAARMTDDGALVYASEGSSQTQLL